ncbi:hypothetical protein I302_102639 [Kwoniella bestiolae CBS 10118]|uniref:Uncharacterized protein n=1 Tax=Kwoniella bestiolae CBS 10118 TaxID=1296100 RepID=A0A1B9GFW0_9TREE|nr:hypothetical protein I302_01328 [Kwoniella bestiolae CBS 10118]OCF29815.1 hypothetical protein I302_01328 [Kwoniella bestiolae CBS 10118]
MEELAEQLRGDPGVAGYNHFLARAQSRGFYQARVQGLHTLDIIHPITYDTTVNYVATTGRASSDVRPLTSKVDPPRINHLYHLHEARIYLDSERAFKDYLKTATDLGELYMYKYQRDDLDTGGSQDVDTLKARIDSQFHACAHHAESLINDSRHPCGNHAARWYRTKCSRESRAVPTPSCHLHRPGTETDHTGNTPLEVLDSIWELVRERMTRNQPMTKAEKVELTGFRASHPSLFSSLA